MMHPQLVLCGLFVCIKNGREETLFERDGRSMSLTICDVAQLTFCCSTVKVQCQRIMQVGSRAVKRHAQTRACCCRDLIAARDKAGNPVQSSRTTSNEKLNALCLFTVLQDRLLEHRT